MTPSTTLRRSLRALLMIFLSATFSATYSQTDTTYRYAAFRLPDIDRKALEAQFSLGGNAANIQRQTLFGTQSFSNGLFSNDIDVYYSRFRNNERIQGQRNIGFTHDLLWSNENESGTTTRFTRYGASLQLNEMTRIYHRPGRFFEYGLNGGIQFTTENGRVSSSPQEVKANRFSLDATIPLKIGRGRIEPIDEVFIAKFMMDDLVANGVLGEDLSEEDLFDLARLMAEVRNQRIFDFRRQIISQLTRLDAWFKEKKLTGGNDILYFTTMNDNWIYAFKNVRGAGYRLSLGVAPQVRYFYQNSGNQLSGNANILTGTSLSVEFERQYPINQYWQSGGTFSVGAQYVIDPNIIEDDFPNQILSPFVSASLSYGYYPNSRTIVSMDGAVMYQHHQGFPVKELSYHLFQPSIGTNLTYFLSYHMQLSGVLRMNYYLASDSEWEVSFGDFGLPASNRDAFYVSGNLSLVYRFF